MTHDPQRDTYAQCEKTSVRRINVDDPQDFEQAVQVMIASFSIMPTWSKSYRYDRDPRARAKVSYYLRAIAQVGEIWATEGPNGMFESVIGFNPPGKVYSDATTTTADNDAFLVTLGEDRAEPRPGRVTFESAEHDLDYVLRSSWNITLIGTLPESAGKGSGRALIRLVSDRADREGKGVWVPTTYAERKRFYEKMGFVSIKTVESTNDLGDLASEFISYRPPVVHA